MPRRDSRPLGSRIVVVSKRHPPDAAGLTSGYNCETRWNIRYTLVWTTHSPDVLQIVACPAPQLRTSARDGL